MSTRRESDLALNPGIRRQKPASPRKCFLWSGIICTGVIVTICTVILFAFAYYIVSSVMRSIRFPNEMVYEHTTLDEVTNRSFIVRPLIDEGQTFDIVASVWIRDAPAEPHVKGWNERVAESLLFSDVVFRGVSLKDRGVMAKVDFQVPTSIFKLEASPHLNSNFDLRGSFTLIPTSPSILHHVVHVSSWIPDSIVVPPARPVKSLDDNSNNQALLDYAIDMYAIHIPLVTVAPINSRCTSVLNVTREQNNGSYEMDNMFSYHPYIVTRSHLRVADFTQILNYTRFNNSFQEFRSKSCGQLGSSEKVPPSWSLCQRTDRFFTTGNALWKTALLQLGIPDESENNITEWAYAPYLSAVEHASGPQDLVPLPVTREKCDLTLSIPDEDVVNVTWKITYSGRTPAKMLFGDILGAVNTTSSLQDQGGSERLNQQFITEIIHGIYGHRHSENSHPRRYLIILLSELCVSILTPIFSLLYWYTRVSTAGISFSGITLIMISDLISCIYRAMVINSKRNDSNFRILHWISLIWEIGPSVILNLSRFKAIMRIQVQWRGLLFPIIRRLPASHIERASMRQDAKSWKLTTTALVLLMMGYLLMRNQLVSAANSWINNTRGTVHIFQIAMLLSMGPLYYAGLISQIALNYQRSTFASMYRITAVGMAIATLGGHLAHFRLFVGDLDVHPKLMFTDYIWTVAAIMNLYQALRYQTVENDSEDKD